MIKKLVLSSAELKQAELTTLSHYDSRALQFWEGTREHDVSQNICALLESLPQNRALDILDLGCGPGRDLIRFKALGHTPIGLDGSHVFCEMAKQNSGCEVLHQTFQTLELAAQSFDGIFANASLFHVPRQVLPGVLKCCYAALKPGGVLFCSNPRGEGEGWNGNRFGNYMEFDVCKMFFEEAGFDVIDHYYRPEGLPNNQQPWLAVLCRKNR